MKNKRDNVIQINNKYSVNENKRRKRDEKIKKIAKFRSIIIFSCCMLALLYVYSKKNEQEEIYDEKVAVNEQLEEDLAELKEKEVELQQSIESLSDPEYLAKIAREEYFLSGEGETVFIVPDENAVTSEEDATTEEAASENQEEEPTEELEETQEPSSESP